MRKIAVAGVLAALCTLAQAPRRGVTAQADFEHLDDERFLDGNEMAKRPTE